MALKPHLWAYDDAPVKNPTAVLVLLALADEAADDGTGACPYVDKLAARARVSVRSVQNYLRDLYQQRIIDIGDPAVSMQRYRRNAGQAPRCWNLNLSATWKAVPEPRSEEEMKAYSPAIGKKPVRRGADKSESPPKTGVQDLHPSDNEGKPGTDDASSAGVQDLHPCQRCSQLHPRGAASCTPEVQPVAPFLSDPLVPDSVPASQVRRDDGKAEASSDGQMTIDGGPELTEEEREKRLKAEATGVARSWVEFRAKHDCPVVMKGRNSDPVMALRNVVLPAMRAGYTKDEVKHALAWTDRGVPDGGEFLDSALPAVRIGGWRPGRDWKPGDGRAGGRRGAAGRQRTGTGPMAGTNRHVDDLSKEQRRAENPFAGASRQSDYAEEGAEQRGAVA